jgi:hypothetical protein
LDIIGWNKINDNRIKSWIKKYIIK